MLHLAVVLTHLLQLALAAHFLRESNFLLLGLTLVVLVALWSHRRWALILNQLQLLAGAAIWLDSAGQVLQTRLEAGEPYPRMLTVLADLTVVSVLVAALWLVPHVRSGWIAAAPSSTPPSTSADGEDLERQARKG